MAEEKPSSRNDALTRCSGDQPLRGGERARWACRAEPGRKFTEITIGPETYDLAEGRVFLLSGEEGQVQVLQLDRDPFELSPGELMRLAKEDPKIGEFFRAESTARE